MNSERWQQVSAALDDLLVLPLADQAEFLEQLRNEDSQLGAEVASLLYQPTPQAHLQAVPKHLWQDLLQAHPVASQEIGAAQQASRSTPKQQDSTGPPNVVYDPAVPFHSEEFPQRAGRYVIRDEIARGGMGAVLRAVDVDIQRTLAIKVMLPAARAHVDAETRFLKEARITGQLQHPGIPPIHELGTLDDGRPFFAMKLIEGHTLATLLTNRTLATTTQEPEQHHARTESQSYNLSRFLSIFEHVCQTLAYAHSRGIIHRDLKPQNVMVGAFGEVQVMDWGLAKRLTEPEATESTLNSISTSVPELPDSRTEAGSVMGTPAYMAPEQARGEIDQLDERCDVFGLGSILCAILTGNAPFQGSSTAEVLKQAARGDLSNTFQSLDRCGADRALVRFAKKCLAAKKEDRYQDAGQVAKVVTQYQQETEEKLRQAEMARQKAQVQAEGERKRRKLLFALGGTAFAVLILATGAVFLLQCQFAEKARQRTELRQSIKSSLEEFDRLQSRASWEEATIVLAKAKDRLGKANLPDLRKQLKKARADLDLVIRLDEIALDKIKSAHGRLQNPQAAIAYKTAFDKAQLWRPGERPAIVAKRVKGLSIHRHLVKGLDDWAFCTTDPRHRAWCLKVAKLIDPGPWKDQIRDPALWNDLTKLENLAERIKLERIPIYMATMLSRSLETVEGKPLALLKRAQFHQPNDFWVNYELGRILSDKKQHAIEAAGYFHAALAVRPKVASIYSYLGLIHGLRNNDWDSALKAYRKATELDPQFAEGYYWIGNILGREGPKRDMAGAIENYRKAIQYKPNFFQAHLELGYALRATLDFEGAIDAYTKAIHLDRQNANAFYMLGHVYRNLGDRNRAALQFQRAVQLNSQKGDYHGDLGVDLFWQGRFAEACLVLKQAVKLTAKEHAHFAKWTSRLAVCERWLALDRKLAALDNGIAIAKDPGEQLALAELCRRYKQRYVAAARFYTTAFAAQPELTENVTEHHLSNAAVAAVLAASGMGNDPGNLDPRQRAKLRQQALGWLRAELAAWNTLLRKRPVKALTTKQGPQHWRQLRDLVPVRDKTALAKLPKAEQQDWQNLWSAVSRVLLTARDSYTEKQWQGTLNRHDKEKTHILKMTAGKDYVIDLTSKQFDTYLRVKNKEGMLLKEDDDGGEGRNSRLLFTPTQNGAHRIIASSFENYGRGTYTLRVREFVGEP